MLLTEMRPERGEWMTFMRQKGGNVTGEMESKVSSPPQSCPSSSYTAACPPRETRPIKLREEPVFPMACVTLADSVNWKWKKGSSFCPENRDFRGSYNFKIYLHIINNKIAPRWLVIKTFFSKDLINMKPECHVAGELAGHSQCVCLTQGRSAATHSGLHLHIVTSHEARCVEVAEDMTQVPPGSVNGITNTGFRVNATLYSLES